MYTLKDKGQKKAKKTQKVQAESRAGMGCVMETPEVIPFEETTALEKKESCLQLRVSPKHI